MKILSLIKTKPVVTAVAGSAVVLALAGGGVYYSKTKSNQTNNNQNQNQNQNEQATTDQSVGKDSSYNNFNPVDNNTTTTTPSSPVASQVDSALKDITVQGVFSADSGQIFTSIYGPAGSFTVEKQVNGQWENVLTNAKYSGLGGLDLNDPIPSDQLQRVYRVYIIVNGQKVGPKEITVERNFVKEKGSASFPSVGAL